MGPWVKSVSYTHLDFNSEVQVTTDGKRNEVINGTTDWVYEEEFSTTRLMEWSPQSDFLAFVRSDESHVKEMCIRDRLLSESGSLYVTLKSRSMSSGANPYSSAIISIID